MLALDLIALAHIVNHSIEQGKGTDVSFTDVSNAACEHDLIPLLEKRIAHGFTLIPKKPKTLRVQAEEHFCNSVLATDARIPEGEGNGLFLAMRLILEAIAAEIGTKGQA